MLRLRLVAGVRHPPLAKSPFGVPARTLYQTHTLAAALAVKAKPRMRPARSQPTMNRGRDTRAPPTRSQLPRPVYNEQAILAQYPNDDLDAKFLKNPKEQLSLYVRKLTDAAPQYACENVYYGGREHWKAVVHTEDGPDDFVGVGEHILKREAERLAALSSVLQGAQNGKCSPRGWTPPPIQPILSDGTLLVLDRAHVFMEYYCIKFNLSNPAINLREMRGRWQAKLSIDGNVIGNGTGSNKKLATTNCYLDAVAYLDKSDIDLWKTFVQETKGRGDAVGSAPPLYLSLGNRLTTSIRDLSSEIKQSQLYQKSPADALAVADASQEASSSIPTSSHFPRDESFYEKKSDELQQSLDAYLADPSHEAIRKQRFSLPIHTRSEELLKLVDSQDVTICMAATGSGKTTQIPQIILDDWTKRGDGSKCNIICTQPRRIAAISVAERVAKERGQSAGSRSQIGYQVRFDAKWPSMHGSVTFCTTGIFLKRMQTALAGVGESHDDRSLDDVTHIVIDEVHERDVDTDLSLAVIKRLLADRKARNKPLKVILMSATIDPTLFQSYFEDDQGKKAKVIDIPGRSFPVDKHYLEDYLVDLAQERVGSTSTNWILNERSVVEYLNKEVGPTAIPQLRQPNQYTSVIQSRTDGNTGEDLDIPFPLVALTVAHVLKKSDSGHVLVFLPGWEEIQSVNRILSDSRKYPLLDMNLSDRSKYSVHLLHSTIPVAEQQQVFEPAAPGVRRIILATNIAETSITIPDVVYVVDSGKVKEKRYDPERHMSSLVSAWVGSSNLNQRAGRAGRHRAGEYYGLVSRARLEQLDPYQLVEMKRADLSNVVMHVKALDFPGMDIEEIFSSLIEPPAQVRVQAALQTLQMTGALTDKEELTPLGRVLLQIPIDAALGRMVLYGALFRALDPALTLAAVLSNREPFNSPPAAKAEAAAAKLSWTPPAPEARSDPIAAVRAFDAWWSLQKAGRYSEANDFCNRHFLNKPVLLMVAKVKLALLQALTQSGVLEIANGGRRVEKVNLQGGAVGRESRAYVVPEELNVHADSLAVLQSLIAIGSQPNFASRTSERAFRTYQDKATIIHPTSTSASFGFGSRSGSQTPRDSWERYIVAFVEKSRNVAAGQAASSATTFLRNVTRLDGMQYMLFGAYKIKETPEGVECDDWLPIQGGAKGNLTQIVDLKAAFERCMQRVFEGIHAANVEKRQAKLKRVGAWTHSAIEGSSSPRTASPVEDEDRDAEAADEHELEDEGEEGDAPKQRRIATPLSNDELLEIGFLTRDIVSVLESFAEDRKLFRMRSRSGTPTSEYSSTRASPSGGAGRARLSEEGSQGTSAFARGLRASGVMGTASPLGGRSPMPSRPSTPFREGHGPRY